MTASTSLEAGRDAIARAPIVRDVVLRLLASRGEPMTCLLYTSDAADEL